MRVGDDGFRVEKQASGGRVRMPAPAPHEFDGFVKDDETGLAHGCV